MQITCLLHIKNSILVPGFINRIEKFYSNPGPSGKCLLLLEKIIKLRQSLFVRTLSALITDHDLSLPPTVVNERSRKIQ